MFSTEAAIGLQTEFQRLQSSVDCSAGMTKDTCCKYNYCVLLCTISQSCALLLIHIIMCIVVCRIDWSGVGAEFFHTQNGAVK